MKFTLGRLNSFIQCPLKYKLANIDLVPPAPRSGAGLSFYKSLTKPLEYFHKEGTKPIPPLEKLLELLDRNWEAQGYGDPAEERQHRQMAEAILRKFHESFVQEKANPVYIGVLVNVPSKKWSLSSRIDRVDLLPDGTYEIINYKTGKSVKEAAELNKDIQAVILYQGANAHKRFEGNVSKVSFYYLRQNRKVSTTPSVEDIKNINRLIEQSAENMRRLAQGQGLISRQVERVVDMLDKVIPFTRTIQADIRDPAALAEKGPLCSTCEFMPSCPAWPVKPRDLTTDSPKTYDERIRLSYSKLGSYKRCPRAWKKVYLDGIGMEPRSFFSFGTAMHEAMEIFCDPRGRRKDSLRYLIKLWDHAFEQYQSGYRDREEAKTYYRHGLEMIKQYHAQFVAGGRFRPAQSVEEYFELPLGKNAVMTGYIDRIDRLEDGSCEILDYKTEPTLRSQQDIDHDDQLTIYFWAAETMLKLKIKQLSLFMMKFNQKLITTRRREDIPQVVAAIDAVAGEMKENIRRHQEEHDASEAECRYLPPRKNKYCRSCDYLETCPLKPDILADQEIRTMEYE